MTAIHVLNGPNLNLLGKREPAIYGSASLDDIRDLLQARCAARGVTLVFRQSNHEGDLVSWIQEAGQAKAPVILNAGALTHTSIALRDACAQLRAPLIEVHISNVYAREEFRHTSYLSGVATGVIVGLGVQGYLLALRYLASGEA